jgi:putative Mg2+ transporter-C (MgtC) family protein
VLLLTDPLATFLGEWAAEINVWSILFRVALSIVLSAVIGCERSTKRHAAGLRTFVLVSMTATVSMLLDLCLASAGNTLFPAISAALVISIAIISSNSILFSSKSQIKGLTTSVGLWGCSIVGLATGAGLYILSVIGFVALFCCLSLFPALEVYLKNRSNHFEVHLELNSKSYLQDFITTIRKLGMRIDDIESNPAYIHSDLSVYTISITIFSAELKKYKTHHEIIEALRSLDYIYYIDEL